MGFLTSGSRKPSLGAGPRTPCWNWASHEAEEGSTQTGDLSLFVVVSKRRSRGRRRGLGRTDRGDELEGAACGVQLEALVVDEELGEERSGRGGDEGGLQAALTWDLGRRGEANIERIRRVALLEGHQTKQDGGGGAMELGRTPFHSWEGERERTTVREREGEK